MSGNTFHSGLRPLNDEYSYRATCVEGRLPDWLRGTFFRNGPGRLEVGGQCFGHWFDGDGLLCKFAFEDGAVHFANRYVRTPKYVRETELNRIDCRSFGTQRPGGFHANFLRPLANPANTSVVWHGNHLLALNEGGRPFALDPRTLETLGEFDYSGGLSPLNMFSAHGKIHPRSGQYINFGMSVRGVGRRGMQPGLSCYRISSKGVLEKKITIPVDCFPFCHDFALTEKHAIFFLGSIRVEHLAGVVFGTRTMADSIRFDPLVPMQILVVDLENFAVVQRAQAPAGAVIHFGNAWEDESYFHIDAMFTDNFTVNNALQDMYHASRLGGGDFLRYRLDKRSGKLEAQVLCDVECEFPQWDNRKSTVLHHQTYAAASVPNGHDSFFNALIRVNAESGACQRQVLPEGCFGSEPMFVPRPGGSAEDDGVLLDVVYNANSRCSELWVLDAADLTQCLAKVLLPHHIPHQFHGFFTPQLF